MKVAIQIYAFLGVKMHPSLQSWIKSRLGDKTDNNPYSTHRNSTKAATHWRTDISFSEVKDIQLMCNSVMKKAGYQFVSTELDLQNHSFNLIEPWLYNKLE